MVLAFPDFVKNHPPHEGNFSKTTRSLSKLAYRSTVVEVIRKICNDNLFLQVTGAQEQRLKDVVQKALDNCPRWASVGEELYLDTKELLTKFPKEYARTEEEDEQMTDI